MFRKEVKGFVVKVLPCYVNNVYNGQAFSASKTKPKMITPAKLQPYAEPDYGKGMKQLSYVIGVSLLSVSSILLGTRGKVRSSIKL